MSRKGKQPIALPKQVEVNITADLVSVKGPKGQLSLKRIRGIDVKKENEEVHVLLR
jgi:large subunit ribosomal protein L6